MEGSVEDASFDLTALPAAAQIEILDHVSDARRLCQLACVASSWRRLIRNTIWKHTSSFELNTFHASLRGSLPWLAQQTRLRSINVSGCSALPEQWLAEMAQHNSRLVDLDVSQCWSFTGTAVLPSLTCNLRTLNLANTAFALLGPGNLVLAITSLRKLDLSGTLDSPRVRCTAFNRSRQAGGSACAFWALLCDWQTQGESPPRHIQ